MTTQEEQNKRVGCATIVVVLIILAIIGSIFGGGHKDSTSGSSSSDGGGGATSASSFDAEYECNDFVKDRLKSPSTAHFPQDTSSNIGDTWTVSGSVDSENGFGAALRSTFTCTMTVNGDTWHLTNLDFNDGGDIN